MMKLIILLLAPLIIVSCLTKNDEDKEVSEKNIIDSSETKEYNGLEITTNKNADGDVLSVISIDIVTGDTALKITREYNAEGEISYVEKVVLMDEYNKYVKEYVQLEYGDDGHVSNMKSNIAEFKIKYDPVVDKPSVVEEVGYATLTMTYTSDGDVDEVLCDPESVSSYTVTNHFLTHIGFAKKLETTLDY